MQPGPGLLHYGARHDVLEGLVELAELIQALLGHVGAPLVHLLLLVGRAPDGALDGVVDDLADVVDDELVVIIHLLGRHLTRILTRLIL